MLLLISRLLLLLSSRGRADISDMYFNVEMRIRNILQALLFLFSGSAAALLHTEVLHGMRLICSAQTPPQATRPLRFM